MRSRALMRRDPRARRSASERAQPPHAVAVDHEADVVGQPSVRRVGPEHVVDGDDEDLVDSGAGPLGGTTPIGGVFSRRGQAGSPASGGGAPRPPPPPPQPPRPLPPAPGESGGPG